MYGQEEKARRHKEKAQREAQRGQTKFNTSREGQEFCKQN